MTLVFDITKTNNPIDRIEITLILNADEECPRAYDIKAIMSAAVDCIPDNIKKLKIVKLEKK